MFLYRYIKEWRKNPQWSLSCCLDLLLPLNDLQDELGGLEVANVLQTQLETGDIEKPSILSALKNSRTIDVTLDEGDDDDENVVKVLDETHQDTVYIETRRQQGTQTELCSLPIPDILVHEPRTDSREIKL